MATQPLGRFFQGARTRQRRAFLVLVVLVMLPLWAVSCVDPDRPPGVTGGHGSTSGGGSIEQPCSDGAQQDCHLEIGRHNGVVTCYNGSQVCSDGVWGPCTDGEVSDKKAAGQIPAALSMPADCVNDPCDPTCKFYDEIPGNVLIGNSTDVFGWTTGNDDSPSPLAVTFPCNSGEDCQSNHYCKFPITEPTCSHSKCATGGALAVGCDSCVDHVCAVDSDCCAQTLSCNAIAGSAPGYTLCGESATACTFYMGNTTQSCNAVCAAQGATCTSALTPSGLCGGAFPPIGCAGVGNPGVLCFCTKPVAGTWDSTCVDEVKSECNSFCSTDTPPAETGQCTQWQPGQVDPDCSGINLTLGITCDNNIPVCNVGDAAVPAGVEVVHFPPGSGQIGSTAPNTSLPGVGTCITTTPIAPGQCVDLDCGALAADTEIMVNPPGAAHLAECSNGAGLDNWTVHTPGACGPPVCKGTESVTNFTRVNMFVMVDKSGSMGSNGMWTPAMNAFKQFFADPNSKGLNVALRFFPSDTPAVGCSYSACNATACATPLVDLGTLVAATAPTDVHETNLINAINATSPGGGTPTHPALNGSLQWATNFAVAHPDETTLIVFVTDGDPTECNTSSTSIISLASNALSSAGVLTYAVGLQGANVTLMNGIAAAGGTNQAFFVSNSSTTTQELLDAMVAIRGGGLSCSFPIPADAQFSPTNTTVEYESGIGPGQTLNQVINAAACGADWYYDDNNNPTQVNLCPTTCATIQGDTDICNGPNEFLDAAVRSCYRFNPSATATWAAARTDCQGWGGDLVAITNNADRAFLLSQTGGNTFWASGNDIATEGAFQWASGQIWSYTNWSGGEPNSSGDEDCLQVLSNGQWNDLNCGNSLRYVCQRAVAPKQVSLVLECPQQFSATPYNEVYEASCPPGTTVQWGYLTYDTITPQTTNILFDARTAETVAGLGTATYHPITTAQSTPSDTQVCAFGSGCEGDLYVGLGGLPDAQYSVMELRATFNPTPDQSLSPELNSWQVTYSCPDYE